MNGGVKSALLISCLGMAACSAGTQSVEVRPIANPSAVLSRGGDLAAVARGQLLLGNVGLALEGFRDAQRADPTDPAALAGIGDCYAAMGRFDLAQSSYETALALAPHDHRLLLGIAVVFDREGQTALAAAARAEAAPVVQAPPQVVAAVQASAAPAAVAPPPPPVEVPEPQLGSITVELPAPRPADHLQARAANLPEGQLHESAPATPVTIASAAQSARMAAKPQSADVPPPYLGKATVALSAAHPVDRLEERAIALLDRLIAPSAPLSPSVTVPLPPARPASEPRIPSQPPLQVAVAGSPAPRLERLTRGEVALVTTGKPIWRSPTNVQVASTNGVRWVALASADKPNVQILNAARSQGLAASARMVLSGRGWRKINIGDAPAAQTSSVVLYSKNHATLGRSLAAQFGVAARMVERDVLVLILGRDGVDKVADQRKS